MVKKRLRVVVLLAAVLIAFGYWRYGTRVRRFLEIDDCLDMGGCWDRYEQRCRHDVERCP